MVGRAFSYRSSSISRGPITISNAGLTESDVIPVLNKEAFRTWQFMRPPRELSGDRNDVSAFRVYSTVCLHLWCLRKCWPDEDRKNSSKSRLNATGGDRFSGVIFQAILY
jgi:hypothetical protein